MLLPSPAEPPVDVRPKSLKPRLFFPELKFVCEELEPTSSPRRTEFKRTDDDTPSSSAILAAAALASAVSSGSCVDLLGPASPGGQYDDDVCRGSFEASMAIPTSNVVRTQLSPLPSKSSERNNVQYDIDCCCWLLRLYFELCYSIVGFHAQERKRHARNGV